MSFLRPSGINAALLEFAARVIPAFFLSVSLSFTTLAAEPRPSPAPQNSAELFNLTTVWTVHLRFTPDQWTTMEPEQGGRGFFRGAGGRGGFAPTASLASTFLQQGDRDQDGKLSQREFRSLGEKWFAEWDTPRRGRLDVDQLRAGLTTVLTQPGAGGLGRPGGRNLQGPEGKRNGLSGASGIDFQYVHADLEFNGQLLKDVAVRYKGNGTFMNSRGSLKRSLKVDLNKYAQGQKLAGVSKLNFHNNVTDASWMNEVLSHRLFRDAAVPAPRTAYARVFVTVPGTYEKEYFGLYSLVEDLDKNFAEENYGTKKGAIFKPVTPSLFADLGDDWKSYHQTYDPKTELTAEQEQRVMDFCKLVTKANDFQFAASLGQHLDLDEFARFMAVTVWLSSLDSILGMGQNFYVYLHPKTGRFQFLPWDLDHSFGQFGMVGGQDLRDHLSIHHPWRGQNPFLERVFKVPAFKKLYLAKLDEFSKTIFQPARFSNQVDQIAAAIRPAVKEESAEKLARFSQVAAGQSVERSSFGGRGGFGQTVQPIKPFVAVRAQSVLAQLAGRSEGETPGDYGFRGGGAARGGRGGRGGGLGGPGSLLTRAFMTALDANADGEVTRTEFIQGFAKWFDAWNTDRTGFLTSDQLRAGIDQDL